MPGPGLVDVFRIPRSPYPNPTPFLAAREVSKMLGRFAYYEAECSCVNSWNLFPFGKEVALTEFCSVCDD